MKNIKLSKKQILLIVIGIIFTVFTGIFLYYLHEEVSVIEYSSNLRHEMEAINNTLNTSDAQWIDAEINYNKIMHSKVASVAYIAQNSEKFNYYHLKGLKDIINVDNLIIIDDDGNIIARAYPTKADFTKNAFNLLKKNADSSLNSYPVEIIYEDQTDYLYYSARIAENAIMVVEEKSDELNKITENFMEWDQLLKNISVGNTGNVSVINPGSYEIIYSTNEELIGMNTIDNGIDADELRDGYIGWVTLDNSRYYVGVSYVDEAYILCMIPVAEIKHNVFNITFTILLYIIALVLLIIIYSVLAVENDDYKLSLYRFKLFKGKVYFNKILGFRLGLIIVFGLLILTFFDIYAQTLFSIGRYSLNNVSRLRKIEKIITNYNADYQETFDYYDSHLEDKCSVLKYIIEEDFDSWDNKKLIELKEKLGINEIELFNKNGTVVASTDSLLGYKLPDNLDNPESEFNKLLLSSSIYVQDPVRNNKGDYYQYAGISLYDEELGIIGLLRIKEEATQKEKILAGTSIETIFDSVVSDIELNEYVIDRDTNTFVYSTEKNLIGRKAEDYGFSNDIIYNGYSGFLSVLGNDYIANCIETKDYYIFIGSKLENLISVRLISSGYTPLVVLLGLLIIYMIVCIGWKDTKKDIEINLKNNIPKHFKTKINSWSKLSPEQIIVNVIKDFLSLVAIIITIVVLLESLDFSKTSVISFILSSDWETGINVFSITAIIISVCIGVVINIILSKVLKGISYYLSRRGMTICRMLKSASRYIIALFIIFYSLRLLGVDPRTLLASAGVLTAVIGLGANSLTADILAGIFLIFEGEFSVGDMVTIDGWRGVVLDIGIRTTKIEDDNFNIKIISNSKMSGIINMSRHLTKSWVYVKIDYGESINRVEEILQREFPNLKEKIPNIIEGPKYEYVDDLGDDGVILTVSYRCHEDVRPITDRKLHREIRLILAENNINVPYPQITINEQIDYSKRNIDNGDN